MAASRAVPRASQVITWILAIARYKAISILQEHRCEPLEDAFAEALVDDADDPHTMLERKDTGERLRHCVQKLSPMHREIVDLVYYHQMSIAEAAEIVGVPCNTDKTRMFTRARG